MFLNTIYFGSTPHPGCQSVTTRILMFFLWGSECTFMCGLLLGGGIDPKYIMYLSTDAGLNCHQQYGFHIPSPRFESSLYISKETIRGCMQTKNPPSQYLFVTSMENDWGLPGHNQHSL